MSAQHPNNLRHFLVVIAVASTLVWLPGCGDRDVDKARAAAVEHRFLAESHLRQGKFGAAMVELQNAEQLAPGESETLSLMARALFAVGSLERAQQLFEQLLDAGKLHPSDEAEYLRLLVRRGRFARVIEYTGNVPRDELAGIRAQALLGKGQRAEAMAQADGALAHQPANADALIARASALFLESDAEAFQQSLERLGDADTAETWLWRARLEQGRGQHEAAISSLSRAMPFFAQHDMMTAGRYEVLRRMMQSLISLGRADEAMTYSNMLANSSAGQLASRYENAISLIRDGNLDGATATFQEILSRSPGHSSSAMALGMIALQRGEYEDAEQYLSTAVDEGASASDAVKYLIALQLQRNDLDNAGQRIDRAIKDYPGDTDLLALKGLIRQRQGQTVEAVALFRQTLDAQPGNIGAHISLGQIALTDGNSEQAERYFRQALAIRPEAADAHRGLVMVADLRGQRDAGMQALRASLRQLERADLWLVAASLALQFDDHAGARRDIDAALTLDPEHARARAMRGALDYLTAREAFAEGRYADAEKHVAAALVSLPNHLGLMLLKASAATARGDRAAALAVADHVKSLGPTLHHGHELEGDIHTQLGDQPAALRAYRQAWDRHRNSVLAGKYLAALRANGLDGLSVLTEWTLAQPDNPEAWLSLASLQQSKNRSADAADSYERLSQLIPDNAGILNNLAWLYQQVGDRRAAATAARAYALAPDNPAIADTYGWILVQTGERERGIGLLEQAARAAPNDADIRAHLEAARRGG
ncbi:MAG: tetratricopeptide repeat protein [Alcanivoracaceae bacterium]